MSGTLRDVAMTTWGLSAYGPALAAVLHAGRRERRAWAFGVGASMLLTPFVSTLVAARYFLRPPSDPA